MEQAESNPDSLRVFTTEKWIVQLGMAARGIVYCSKCGTSGRSELAIHRLSEVRNERNNAALHKAETAAASHKAAETE